MTSATDNLRRLLDERGVEWDDDGYPTTCTVWASDGIVWHGLWRDDYIELIAHLTPEQAVEATLGRGTCHECAGMEDVFECSECGMRYEGWALKRWARYCPNCGRKVKED